MPGSELTRGGGAAPGKGEGGTYTAQTEGVGGDHTQDPEGEPSTGPRGDPGREGEAGAGAGGGGSIEVAGQLSESLSTTIPSTGLSKELYMDACGKVCMYACMHVPMYVCMCTCVHVCMYACMHVCL